MRSILLLFFAVLILCFGCKKNKSENPIDQLPPETQTGARTFGCLIDGHAFTPSGSTLTGTPLTCAYQLVNNGYYLGLMANTRISNGLIRSIGLFTDSVEIQEGVIYQLGKRINGSTSAMYFKELSSSEYEQYQTDGIIYKGELHIKKLDVFNHILAGTFWFDATVNGKKVEVREGRFDLPFVE